jgi:Ni/Co efflux regulator RcnB
MTRPILAALIAALTVTSAPAAFAQPGRDHDRNDRGGDRGHSEYRAHNDWQRGHRIRHEDWDRGRPVDWRQNHLRRPTRGYEWREVDGNYVLAAAATGLIASAIAHGR